MQDGRWLISQSHGSNSMNLENETGRVTSWRRKWAAGLGGSGTEVYWYTVDIVGIAKAPPRLSWNCVKDPLVMSRFKWELVALWGRRLANLIRDMWHPLLTLYEANNWKDRSFKEEKLYKWKKTICFFVSVTMRRRSERRHKAAANYWTEWTDGFVETRLHDVCTQQVWVMTPWPENTECRQQPGADEAHEDKYKQEYGDSTAEAFSFL